MRGSMTPLRSIRVPEELWVAVKVKAKANHFSVTQIVIMALQDYLKD